MKTRMNYATAAPGTLDALLALSKSLQQSGLSKSLLDLICLRASQINGCAYCIDMHWKDLRAEGSDEQKLYMLDAWRDWPEGYNEQERAALEWTEAVTLVSQDRVPGEIYERARQQFSESELAWLTLAGVTINGWNRMNIAFRTPAGHYRVPSKTGQAGS